MKSRARQILDKSIDAMLAAIEIYNKPTFSYREEAFSILAINAWELLLKARILQVDDNRMSSIIEYEHRQLQDGSTSIKRYRKKSRSGNHVSIGLFKAFDRLVNNYGDTVDSKVRQNLEALIEIRDNAVHFMNKDLDLRKKIHEISTACLKNYLNTIAKWFAVSMSEYDLFLMPIAFLRDIRSAEGIILNNEERNLMKYMQAIESSIDDDETKDYNFSLDVEIKFKRVPDPASTNVIITNSPDAIPVRLEEADIREKYPWDYKMLCTRLRKRYTDFKQNTFYHDIRKELEENAKLCKPRYLDPGNTNSSMKNFYSPNIVKEFDIHYSRKPHD